jgi:hypothetical protein
MSIVAASTTAFEHLTGLNDAPKSPVGRLVVSAVLVVDVALAGLFTASVGVDPD